MSNFPYREGMSLAEARENLILIGSEDIWAYRYQGLWVPDEVENLFTSEEILQRAELVKQWHEKMDRVSAARVSAARVSDELKKKKNWMTKNSNAKKIKCKC